jgi:hypothetical protein
MAELEKHWIRELELRFGVRAEFSQRLLPLLRSLAASGPSDTEWSAVLLAVADAYGTAAAGTESAADETLRMFSQFHLELRKMDESLKMLAACLSRVRTQLRRTVPGGSIH